MAKLFVTKKCNWQIVMYDAARNESVQTITTKSKSGINPIALERCTLRMGDLLDDDHYGEEPLAQQTLTRRVERVD